MNETNQLQRVNRTLKAITRINKAIFDIRHEPRRLLTEVCDILVQEREYATVWIGEQHQNSLYPVAAASGNDQNQDALQTWITQALYDRTAVQQALRGAKTVVSGKAKKLPGSEETHTWITTAVPIQVNNEVRAILSACATAPDAFDAAEIQLLEELATNIGFALESMEAETRRLQAEEALRTSEERFRRLAEHSLVGIVLIQNDMLRYVNPATARMFGYEDAGELIDRLGPLDLTAPESRDLVKSNVDRRISGEIDAIRYTFKGLRKDGSTFDVEAHGSRAIHARRPAIISTVMDITERERARRQLEALSEAGLALSRARTTHEALQKAVEKATNVVPGDAANIFLLREQGFEWVAQAGYPRFGDEARILIQSGVHTEMPFTYKRMLATRAPMTIADTDNSKLWTRSPKTQSVRAYVGAPLVVRGEIIGFLNVDGTRPGQFIEADAQHLQLFADYVAATIEHLRLIDTLTEEHQRLTILNELSQTLSETLELKEVARRAITHIGKALNGLHGVIHLWDSRERALITISEQGVVHAIPTASDVDEKDVEHDLLQWIANQRKVGRTARLAALDIPLEVRGELIGVLTLLGEETQFIEEDTHRLLRTLSVPIALALQNARFYEAAAHQAVVMEEALRRQEELDQMKDELLQNISHELRTPLALVTGYTQMLQNGTLGPMPDQQAEIIDIISRRSTMLRNLVENVTLHWQIENPKDEIALLEVIDLCEFVRQASTEFQNEAQQQKLTLATEIPSTPMLIKSVSLQLHRLIDNLLSNALKFTQSGGQIKIGMKAQGDSVILAVCDTGIGVPEDKLEYIFERFYQVDGSATRRYGGVGLGLALAKSIVEAHRGQIWAESPVTKDPEHPGTCIQIRLPLAEVSAPTQR